MDSIGGMLNHIGKMPKTHYKNKFCNGFTRKKLMVYNGILMEIIGISVMVSIGACCSKSWIYISAEHYYL